MDFGDYLGRDIPKLGFGLMRLPRVDGMGSAVDMPQLKEMVDLFMGAGFTYFDTAYGYEDSEVSAKEALVDRYSRELSVGHQASCLERKNAGALRVSVL